MPRSGRSAPAPVADIGDWQHPYPMLSIAPRFFGLLWWLGLPVGLPATEVVNSIEARVRHDKCVGSLASWHRQYQFQIRGSEINRGFVSLAYVKGGHNGLPAGRFVTEPQLSGIDDSQHLLVFAEYEIASGRFTDWVCGWNFPPRSAADGS